MEEKGLLLVAGGGLLTTFPLLRDEVVIGRGSDCDVSLPHEALSRRHALLRLSPALSVQDLGSRNGTGVLGEVRRGGAPVPLAVGERFQIAELSFVVVRSAATASHGGSLDSGDGLTVIDPTHPGPLLSDIAESGVNVLILGETGVGKDVLAETLHRASKRSGPNQRINCAALTGALVESELFGHAKGAFTGATQDKPGLLEAASGGTAFLDEVGELPLSLQAKLLRVLESKEAMRVGAVKPVPIDVRFISATNRELAAEVERGQFRADLYFRLDGVTLVIPPLRARRHLIGPLALQFLRRRGEEAELERDVLPALELHDWPGNVRQLKAVCERALLLARGGRVSARHVAKALEHSVRTTVRSSAATDTPPSPAPPQIEAPPAGTVAPPELSSEDASERQRIVDALAACGGNQTRAAKHLGMARATLVYKLALYRIPRPRR